MVCRWNIGRDEFFMEPDENGNHVDIIDYRFLEIDVINLKKQLEEKDKIIEMMKRDIKFWMETFR